MDLMCESSPLVLDGVYTTRTHALGVSLGGMQRPEGTDPCSTVHSLRVAQSKCCGAGGVTDAQPGLSATEPSASCCPL